MRFIKRLFLQGYKTFASPTEFLFDSGVTAIVGPNGSGKSNVADSLRWVLGEQSYGALRGKRTEDMIFAGSEQRARLGMAHVSLTFDNAAGWLPIDYSEVEVSRRAYRSGENEYYLNGSRVRLRDIIEMLAGSGLSERTYAIIGQGLVDQALSQRPEERRKLFEEAAGITVHQSKRELASQRLDEAHVNLTRARDIINELTPRLRYLKGQARRAQEYQQVKKDLDAQLGLWYGYKWRQAVLALAAAQKRLEDARAANANQAAALQVLLDEMAARRAERAELRECLGDWHRRSSQLHREAELAQRDVAVRSEQLRMWREQEADLEQELTHLQAVAEDGAVRLRAAEAKLAEAREEHAARAQRVAGVQRELEAREKERQILVRRLAAEQDTLLALKTRIAEQGTLRQQLADRQNELAVADAEQARAAAAARTDIASLEREISAVAEQAAACEADMARLETDLRAHNAAIGTAQDSERPVQEGLNAALRALARLQDQMDLLARMRDEGAGMGAGARSVLAAAKRGELRGIMGALGDLIEVPGELERAIDAALGGRQQDVVVRRWEDADAAVTHLKSSQGGRATFLPLDSLRPGRPTEVPGQAGVVGRASDLVAFDATIRPAVELALNHVLVVEDLSAARRLLSLHGRRGAGADASRGFTPTLVTLEGDIVRPGGSVTGGTESQRRDSGILARARALRDLPEQIRAAQAEVRSWEERLAQARETQLSIRSAMASLGKEREAVRARAQGLEREVTRLRLGLERAQQTRLWHEERRASGKAEAGRLRKREEELGAALEPLRSRLAHQEAQVEAARLKAASAGSDEPMARLAQLRAEAAVSEGQLRSHEARLHEISALQADRSQERLAKATRVETLARQQREAEAAIREQQAQIDALTEQIGAFSRQIDPAEVRVSQLEQAQRSSESIEQTLREEARQAQLRLSQAELALQRANDDLGHLRGEIEKDLGLVVVASTTDTEAGSPVQAGEDDWEQNQPPLPLDETVTRLPAVIVLPEGLDTDVRNLRAQLARLGPVNLEALQEYNEVEARFNFLSSQATDLEKAVASLQEVILELERVMEREFQSTFKAVAAQFREEFTGLFGGGSAKLVLTDPESPSTTGVEIMARPPGKREQGLALLSGGERALTAAALIFSILKTRPTPFCVLDEVDATLDEANVGRFREALRALSSQTQFILITHNRGTIEVADTIYGVSIGSDNTSQVLSLKLQGRDVVPSPAQHND